MVLEKLDIHRKKGKRRNWCRPHTFKKKINSKWVISQGENLGDPMLDNEFLDWAPKVQSMKEKLIGTSLQLKTYGVGETYALQKTLLND